MSLRSACDIRRACRPTWLSPMSPSISARGVSAATESMTMTSMAPGAHEHVGDLERLLAGVGLRDEQLVDVDPDCLGVDGIHRVLGVDVGADAAVALGLGHHVQREGGLARRLGAVDLGDAAPRQATDAQGEIERQRPRGDGLDGHRALLAHLHDGALAELLLDLPEGHVECLLTIHGVSFLPRLGLPLGGRIRYVIDPTKGV